MDARLTTVIEIMHRLTGGDVSMPALSKSVNLSPSRLRQLFKKEIGRSPMQYLQDLRMQNAERMLTSTFLSVKEVAFACGISDVSSFVRHFKKRCGLTPSQFRVRSERSLNSPANVSTNSE